MAKRTKKMYRSGRVFKRGKVWYIDYHDPVLRRRVKKAVSAKKFEAEAELTTALQRVYQGQAGIEEVEEISFSAFADEYLVKYCKPSKTEGTTYRDDITLNKHLKPFFGDVSLSSITAGRIEDYKATRRAKVSASTVNRELNTFKSLFQRAVEWGRLKENPARKVKKFKVDEKAPRFLEAHEGGALMDAAEGQMKGFIMTALNAGLRKGELFQLEWGDVDFDRRQIIVRKAKGKRFRAIPMNDLLYEALRKHPRHITSPYVFHNRDGSRWHDVRASFETTLTRAGLPHIRIHDMRHTFVSNLFMAGVDPRTIQELAGHRDIRTTMRYAHVAPGHLKGSVEKLVWKESVPKLAQTQE